jgi:lipid-A-disaccharide synthase-like uncharacterized protein
MDYILHLLKLDNLTPLQMAMVAVGFVGEVLFGLRFVVQWLISEKHKRSVVPVAFWYFSIGGAVLLLAYAISRRDPVFILGIAPTIPIYARNLHLIYRRQREESAEVVPAAPAPQAQQPGEPNGER